MGVAFLMGADLIRAEVENVRTPGMRPDEVVRKAERVLRRWIDRYQPEVLAIEATFFAQSKRSRHLKRLITAITALGEREGLPVRLYRPTAVRRLICRQGRPTRLAVARVLATDYFPWLLPYYEKESRKSWWRKRYWTGMFDAIAVGLACHRESADARHRREAA
jgi:hypothetical protein